MVVVLVGRVLDSVVRGRPLREIGMSVWEGCNLTLLLRCIDVAIYHRKVLKDNILGVSKSTIHVLNGVCNFLTIILAAKGDIRYVVHRSASASS